MAKFFLAPIAFALALLIGCLRRSICKNLELCKCHN
jgi:hypothetical protein